MAEPEPPSPPEPSAAAQEEEQKQLRPYRRFVRIVFFGALIVLCGFVFRGIVRHLDRMPGVDTLYQPQVVDARALRACAEDLERLENQVRRAAGLAFSAAPGPEEAPAPDPWAPEAKAFELERLKIVARCRLRENGGDPAVAQLAAAADGIEALLRSYSLIYGRHEQDGFAAIREIQRALAQAFSALKGR